MRPLIVIENQFGNCFEKTDLFRNNINFFACETVKWYNNIQVITMQDRTLFIAPSLYVNGGQGNYWAITGVSLFVP